MSFSLHHFLNSKVFVDTVTMYQIEKISLQFIDLPQPVLGTKDKAKDMIAAIMRIISVTSCTASQSSCRKVFGGFGGIILTPYLAWRVLI